MKSNLFIKKGFKIYFIQKYQKIDFIRFDSIFTFYCQVLIDYTSLKIVTKYNFGTYRTIYCSYLRLIRTYSKILLQRSCVAEPFENSRTLEPKFLSPINKSARTVVAQLIRVSSVKYMCDYKSNF